MNETIKLALLCIGCMAVGGLVTAVYLKLQLIPESQEEPMMCSTYNETPLQLAKLDYHSTLVDLRICEENIRNLQQKNANVSSSWNGRYTPNTGVLEIFTANMYDKSEALYTFEHEWAHKMWFELSDKEKEGWELKFKEETDFVSEYAKVNVVEYYAEVMATTS